jgi:Rieske 2Fe-2S family protein
LDLTAKEIKMPSQLAAPLSADTISSLLEGGFAAARTLPAEAYLSNDVLDWERRNVFDTNWICVGRSDLVPEPGSQRGIRLGTSGVLLVRDLKGSVRAFYNSCRHRGHELLQEGECRRKRAIACPYHAWVYSLEGELVRASRFTDMENFDAEEFPLIPLSAAESSGWIFVSADTPNRPFTDTIGDLGKYLKNWEPERLEVGAKHEYVVKANWKLIVENFVECYHCPSIHPELCAVADPDSGTAMFPQQGMWIGGPMELRENAETQSLDGSSGGLQFRNLTDQERREVRYFVLFPNLLISPHPDYLMTHRLQPIGPTETYVECAWLFPPEALEQPEFDPSFAAEFWDRTNSQDFGACESVQRAISSPGYRPGPFDHRELVVHTFQLMMARAYADGSMPMPAIADLAPA